ncbi:MAG: DMT family transporter [Sphingomonas fennica]
MLIALAAMWGGSFLFNGVAMRDLPVLTVVTARVGLAAIVLAMISKACGQPFPRGRVAWTSLVAMGLLNNVLPFVLIVAGQRDVGAGAASILNAATPLFTVLVGSLLTDEGRMTAGKAAGVVIGFGGVAVMIGAGGPHPASSGGVGSLLCLGGALSYAVAGLYGRRFGPMGLSPLAVATGQVTASALSLLPLALAIDRPWTLAPPGPAAASALAGLAIVSTAFAYVLYFRILATAGATNLLLVTFLIPICAILFGIAFLGERLMPQHVCGMALIGCGLAAIDGRVVGRLRRRRAERPDP